MHSPNSPAGQNGNRSRIARHTNWHTAHRRAFGPNTESGWLKDLDAAGSEVYTVADEALVLVDRAPIRTDGQCRAYVRKDGLGTGSARLNLVVGPDQVTDSVAHGVYGGRVGDAVVHMDQYVKIRNGVPLAIVRILQRANKPLQGCVLEGIVKRFLGPEAAALPGG